MKKNNLKTIVYTILIGLVIGAVALKSTGMFDHMSSLESFKTYIEGFGNKAYIVFFIMQLLSIIIAPIPSNISATAGAMVFGMWQAFFMTMAAVVLGSIITFLLSKKFGRKFTDRFVSKEVYDKYEGIITSPKGELAISLMLLLPFFPDDMINFLVGLSNMSLKRFIIILLITRPLGILFSVALGVVKINIPVWGWLLIVAAIVLVIKNGSKIENGLTKAVESV